jgi:hypothetical protein
MTSEFDALQEQLGCVFHDPALLRLALTHPSVAHEHSASVPHNQRLEFLGDAVLQLILTRELYERFPCAGEGPLTKARARLVNRRYLAEQVIADNRRAVFNAWRVLDDLLHFPHHTVGALQRSGIRQLQGCHQVPLVFLGEETAGQPVAEQYRDDGNSRQQDQTEEALLDGDTAEADITVRRTAEDLVETVVKPLQQARAFLFGLRSRADRAGLTGTGLAHPISGKFVNS